MSPFIGEIIGTALMILLGEGVVAGVALHKSKAYNGGFVIVTFAWGLAVTIAVYAVGHFSGAHLNPAVTIALATAGSFPWSDVPGYILAQFIGAMIGAALVWLHYLPHWAATPDPQDKLGVFATSPAIRSLGANLMSEIIATFVLIIGILAIGATKFAEGLNPLIVGFLVVVVGMSLGGTTGYAINPARDLGPRIMHALLPIKGKAHSDWGYAWVPVVGPVIGAVLAAIFYKACFAA